MSTTTFTQDEATHILTRLGAVSEVHITDIRLWAKQAGVPANGSKMDIAERIATVLQRQLADTAPKPDPAPAGEVKAPRNVRMHVVRKDGTERTTNWRTEDNARQFAVKALAEGDYLSAKIEVGDEWIEVVAD